jgi:hypothetical protein
MSDLFDEWLANGASGFGTQTRAILATQDPTQFQQVGIQFSQQFWRAVVAAATANGAN